jgi:stress response protein SCP2
MADLVKHGESKRTGPSYKLYVFWRSEEGDGPAAVQKAVSFFGGGAIDLDIIAMGANAQKKFVGVCHQKDKTPFDGALRAGKNTKAKAGQQAMESIEMNLDALLRNPAVTSLVFGTTCQSSAVAMAELAELRYKVVKIDENGAEEVILEDYRSIEGSATAALFVRIDMGPDGAIFTEIDDTFTPRESGRKWRATLLEEARSALR